MAEKSKLTNSPALFTAVGAVLILSFLLLLVFPSNEGEAAPYETTEVVSITAVKLVGESAGNLSSGDHVSPGDVVKITAENRSDPINSDDLALVDLNVHDENNMLMYSITWKMNYTGTGANFTGNLTFRNDLSGDYSYNNDTRTNIEINVSDGYSVYLFEHNNASNEFYFFRIDDSGPQVTIDETSWLIQEFKSQPYCSRDSPFNLLISDESSNHTWFIDDHSKYSWDNSTWYFWNGSSFKPENESDTYTLYLSIWDRLDHMTNLSKTYKKATFHTNFSLSNENKGYNDTTVFLDNSKVGRNGTLTFTNCTIVFTRNLTTSNGSMLGVEDGGKVLITGPPGDKDTVKSEVGSTGGWYQIKSYKGASVDINHTLFVDGGTEHRELPILHLSSGSLDGCYFEKLNHRIYFTGSNVTFQNSWMDVKHDFGRIEMDLFHKIGAQPVILTNLKINGTNDYPIIIKNASIWTPYDLVDRSIYYADENASMNIDVDTTKWKNPYLHIPYFVDSRDTESVFTVKYENDTGWQDLFTSVSNTILDDTEWKNGEGAKINVSGLRTVFHLNISWNSTTGQGCAYIGHPMIGGSDDSPSPLSFHTNSWYDRTNNVAANLDNITFENAYEGFLKVGSSGRIGISKLVFDTSHTAPAMVELDNSSVSISDTLFNGTSNANYGISSSFTAGDDWGKVELTNLTFCNIDRTGGVSVYCSGGWVDMNEITINRTDFGIKSEGALFNMDRVNISSNNYGAKIKLPSSYPETADSILDDLTVETFQTCGLRIEGTALNYCLNLDIVSFDGWMSSSEILTRDDGVGGLSLDVSSDIPSYCEIAGGNINGTIPNGIISGAGHGIAIVNWPSGGSVRITENAQVSYVKLDLLYLGDDITLHAEDINLFNADGYIIKAGDGCSITVKGRSSSQKTNLRFGGTGGVKTGSNGTLQLDSVDIYSCSGKGIDLGTNMTMNLKSSIVHTNNIGVEIGEGSTVEILDTEISYNQGGGVIADSPKSVKISKQPLITWNSGDGLYMEGGILDIDNSEFSFNSNGGSGIVLKNVELNTFLNVKLTNNSGDGLNIHIGTDSVLDASDNYGLLENFKCYGNGGDGIEFTYDSSVVSDPIYVEIQSSISPSATEIYTNDGYDLIAPPRIAITWTLYGTNTLGRDTSDAVFKADLDFIIESNVEFHNIKMVLLGSDNQIKVKTSCSLTMWNCDIGPQMNYNGFSIELSQNSTFNTNGGTFKYLEKLEADGTTQLKLKGTIFKYGSGAVFSQHASITIDNCGFEGIDGTAVEIQYGSGHIKGSYFKYCDEGVRILGPSDVIEIEDCIFRDTNRGLHFSANYSRGAFATPKISVISTSFIDPTPTSILVKSGDLYLYDTLVDPSTILVQGTKSNVFIFYMLSVKVMDEEAKEVPFDLNIKRGSSAEQQVSSTEEYPIFSAEYRSYKVQSDKITDSSHVILTMTYDYGSEIKIITLDRPTEVVFDGFTAPWKSDQFPDFLEANEDIGLNTPGNLVDVSDWFDDFEMDADSLSYRVEIGTPQIMPLLSGTMLSLELDEDWYNETIENNFTIIATDRHGKSFHTMVKVKVLEINDLPEARNPRIECDIISRPDNPITGDPIRAVWDWHDVDDGDGQPSYYRIDWYMNGLLQENYGGIQYKDHRTIPGRHPTDGSLIVKSGQVWTFTIYPRDRDWIIGETGEPTTSPSIMIGNSPPTLASVKIATDPISSSTDLMALPSGWSDDESNVITFHYLWEKGGPSGSWEPLGASDSPILSYVYIRKGDTIRVKAWVHDGTDMSSFVDDTVRIPNTPPRIITAKLSPEIVDETVKIVRVTDIVWEDADNDEVTFKFLWKVGGLAAGMSDEIPEILREWRRWEYPTNISVEVIPIDSDLDQGDSYIIAVSITPRDTDGDGLFDDANNNGKNDVKMGAVPADDKDDDNDGFQDDWETHEAINTDPKDPLSVPLDTDGDGRPDGNQLNTEAWMDLDDDNDGVWDIYPDSPAGTEWGDTFPKIAALPGDFDGDHIGDDQDPDIDNDGVLNEEDDFPYNANRWSEEEFDQSMYLEVFTLIIIIILIAGLGYLGYLFYTGRIDLPITAPPSIGEEKEAILDEDEGGKGERGKRIPSFDEEDLENMRACSLCGELVSLEDSICPNCAAIFDDDEDFEEEFDDLEGLEE